MSPEPSRPGNGPHGVTTLHGVFLSVQGLGVLVTGGSGIGKGRLALELITRGHALVCDDTPEFSNSTASGLVGSGPQELAEFLMVRGLGVVNIRRTFGDHAVLRRERLGLIVELSQGPAPEHDLEPAYTLTTVLGQQIPTAPLSLMGPFSPVLLLETLVRSHALRRQGYRACEDFAVRQRRWIEEQE